MKNQKEIKELISKIREEITGIIEPTEQINQYFTKIEELLSFTHKKC